MYSNGGFGVIFENKNRNLIRKCVNLLLTTIMVIFGATGIAQGGCGRFAV